MIYKALSIAILTTAATLLTTPALALTPKLPEITPGLYWLGGTDQGLEVTETQYRYYSEGGEGPWQPISDLSPLRVGVVFDGRNDWCLSTMQPSSGATCTQNGWVAHNQDDRDRLLFSCATNNNQQILLYDRQKTIDYSFGRKNSTPELELRVPRDRASTWQWRGVGRTITYYIDVPNGDTTYRVFWDLDRLSKTREVDAGVMAYRNGKVIANVKCAKDIVNNMQGIDLPPT